MTLTGLLVFLAAYLMAVASPGPAVAAVVARALGGGLGRMALFILGIALGDMVWFMVAATGLAVIAKTYAGLIVAIKIAGALYLLYLAWRLWVTPAAPVHEEAQPIAEPGWRQLLGGLALTLGNPKPIVFFMAILPTIVDLERLTPAGMLEIAVIIPIGISSVMGAYAFAADRARRLFTSARSLARLNRATALVMAGAAAAVARS